MMQTKDNLFDYYQQELEFLRKFSRQFAQAHPAAAGRLIANNAHPDPFTDRVIEAIGLLNARNHLKLDAEFSETCAALLECIAPQSLAPVPAMSIVQFTPEATNTTVNIPAKSVLTSTTLMGKPCYFTTGFDTECHPLGITKIHLSTDIPILSNKLYTSKSYQSSLCIQLESPAKINLNHIRFFIHAQPAYAYMFYELLFKNTQTIILADSADDRNPVILNKNYLKADGFDPEQCLLPYYPRQSREHILLAEFFNCPEKFLFFSLCNLENFLIQKNTQSLFIYILFDTVNNQLEKHLTPDFLALNCTPVINIFPALSEPIHINHTQNEYLLRARLDHHPIVTEIYNIQEISAYNTQNQEVLFHPPYHPSSHIHHFYHLIRRATPQSEIYLAFSTNYPKLFYNQEWIASAKILCTNRHLVSQLPYGGNLPHIYFQDKNHQTHMSNIKILIPFTAVKDMPLDHESIIHRLLSTLFIYQSPRDFLSFQRTVQLFESNHPLLSAIVNLEYHFAQHRIHTRDIGHAIINGTDINIQIDAGKISQSQAFFFCSILERYFAFQTDINAYTSLILINLQQEEIYRWPLRCGEIEINA